MNLMDHAMKGHSQMISSKVEELIEQTQANPMMAVGKKGWNTERESIAGRTGTNTKDITSWD